MGASEYRGKPPNALRAKGLEKEEEEEEEEEEVLYYNGNTIRIVWYGGTFYYGTFVHPHSFHNSPHTLTHGTCIFAILPLSPSLYSSSHRMDVGRK
jgi:hypothetical protein